MMPCQHCGKPRTQSDARFGTSCKDCENKRRRVRYATDVTYRNKLKLQKSRSYSRRKAGLGTTRQTVLDCRKIMEACE